MTEQTKRAGFDFDLGSTEASPDCVSGLLTKRDLMIAHTGMMMGAKWMCDVLKEDIGLTLEDEQEKSLAYKVCTDGPLNLMIMDREYLTKHLSNSLKLHAAFFDMLDPQIGKMLKMAASDELAGDYLRKERIKLEIEERVRKEEEKKNNK